jgi:hypothetical protein
LVFKLNGGRLPQVRAAFFQNTNMENTEYQAGATLVDQGISFDVPGLIWGKNRLTIKPLKPGTIVRISMEATKLQEITETEDIIPELLAKGENLNVIANILAHSIINRKLSRRWLFWYYRYLMLNRVESLQYLFSYLGLVYRQIGAQHFFFIMALTKGMNFLQKKTVAESKEAEKPFGEPSQSSKKHSN